MMEVDFKWLGGSFSEQWRVSYDEQLVLGELKFMP